MFLVVSRLEAYFAREQPFVLTRSGAQVKLRARKIGRLERNVSTLALAPENIFIKRNN